MSRSYNMLVKVNGFDPEKIDCIKYAAEDEWDFDDWSEHHHEDSISTSACGNGRSLGSVTGCCRSSSFSCRC